MKTVFQRDRSLLIEFNSLVISILQWALLSTIFFLKFK